MLAVFSTFLPPDTTENFSFLEFKLPATFSPCTQESEFQHRAHRRTFQPSPPPFTPRPHRPPLHASRACAPASTGPPSRFTFNAPPPTPPLRTGPPPPTTRNQTDPKQPRAYLLIPIPPTLNSKLQISPPYLTPRPSFHQRPIIYNPYNPQTLFILTPRHSRSLPVTTSRCTIITKLMNIVMINPARPKTVTFFPRLTDFFTELQRLFARFQKKSRTFSIFHRLLTCPGPPHTTTD